jgi:amino acid adenylation domain-containing protein
MNQETMVSTETTLLKDLSRAELAHDKCVHELFEAQAELTPDAVAVVFGAQQMSYGELNARANQLAHYLRACGVGPESLVAICTERSPEMLIGLLGILKAGGAYLPLDPAYPQERLEFMLMDAKASVLLTQQPFLTTLPQTDARTICLDRDWKLIAHESANNPPLVATAANLAYAIYTSGSTGKPKGVLVTHQNIVRLFAQTRGWFQFDERDVWTLFHSYAFDFSVWEIWGALNYGGRLVVVPYSVSRSPESFCDLLGEQQVTVLNQTPSAFRQLIQAEASRAGTREPALRLVIFGGEALDVRSLRPWLARHGDERPQLVNMYGITETTVHVTYRPLNSADMDQAPASFIGGPIADLDLYVLDEWNQIAPAGVSGELYVGGAGLARGYLDRPDLTAERFIPDPFSNQPGGRLYRTGDRVRRANGDLEYLGRVDNQVKVRGFRMEPGEIEAVLREHPLVREGVVLAREDSAAEKRLVAYIVPTDHQSPASDELRAFLLAKLPDYMVPSSVITLDSLPMTPNGKVNRHALHALAHHGVRRQEFTHARTPVEDALMRIWAEVFRLEWVGINDNFFELGGDSILGTLIVARAARRGLKLSPRQIFEHQTIASLSAMIASGGYTLGEASFPLSQANRSATVIER